MKIIEWNINKRSRKEETRPFVCQRILSENADVICLVEYTKDELILAALSNLYWVFESEKLSGNQVLLAVKKRFVIEKPEVVRKTDEPGCYNFLHIKLKLKSGEIFSVIGLRMLTGFEPINAEKQTPPLKKYIANEIKEKYIALGDFNIIYSRMKEKWFPENEGYRIQDVSTNHKDINLNSFFFISKDERKITDMRSLDHILYQEPVVAKAKYSWDFVNDDDIYPNVEDLHMGAFWNISPPYPDHAMLIAEVSLNGEEDLK